MNIKDLYIYPIKSASAQKTKLLSISHLGPAGDREWMLIDQEGQFLSQRRLPKMATIEVFLEEESLTVAFQKMFFKISKKNSFQRKVIATLWDSPFEVALEPDLYSQAISQYLEVSCRLVRHMPTTNRRLKSDNPGWQPEVRFADQRPIQILNLKSLEDLNGRLEQSVSYDRFRPNIVFSGAEAFEEEQWRRIRIGQVEFANPKLCQRCHVITIDQTTGLASGPEPLKTLSSYRQKENKVFFGTLWIPQNEGVVAETDSIEVIE
ncbi:MAG: hypothetical protein RJB66_995 [Pseudomonadota bacterium]|jgi:uncharacterized protein YcbX